MHFGTGVNSGSNAGEKEWRHNIIPVQISHSNGPAREIPSQHDTVMI